MSNVVNLAQGRIEGFEKPTGDGVAPGGGATAIHVRAIPYATAGPKYRFKPAGPAPTWEGVRPGMAFSPGVPQVPGMLEQAMGNNQNSFDEDALTLNVVTPGLDDGDRAVMVWIHGGAFTNGSASIPWYNGTGFAVDHDVVIVTINYRLGLLGGLHLGLVDGHGEAINLGIQDQIAALDWVAENIHHFGGDPNKVTIFGESAGGMSVSTLMSSPKARERFHRVIAQSGAAQNASSVETAQEMVEFGLTRIGIGPRDIDDMREWPLERIMDAQTAMDIPMLRQFSTRNGLMHLSFQPVVDGTLIPRPPLEAIAAGDAADIDLMSGTTRDEMKLFAIADPKVATLDWDQCRSRMSASVGQNGAETLEAAYRAEDSDRSAKDTWIAYETDRVFRMPSLRMTDAHSAAGGSTYGYWFTYATNAMGGLLGSCHALEIPFVFNIVDKPSARLFTGDAEGQGELAANMNAAWAAFARSGSPGDGLDTAWPAYDEDSRQVMRFDTDMVGVVTDPQSGPRKAWTKLG